MTLTQLFNNDDKSLQTFANHITNELQKKQLQESVAFDSWSRSTHFTLSNEQLTIYFTKDQLINNTVDIIKIPVSLSYLNPLLAAEFQTSMVQVEDTDNDIIAVEAKAQTNELAVQLGEDATSLNGQEAIYTPAVGTDVDKTVGSNNAATEPVIFKPIEANTDQQLEPAVTTKRIALTFDDGPHETVTPQILRILEKYKAKATFFVLGNRVSQHPEIVQEAFNAQHEIANHTWSHPQLPQLSADQILYEFQTTENAIQKVIGQPTALFRPPYGSTNDTIKALIPRTSINWTIDTEDWKHRNADHLVAAIQQTACDNGIVLMHDIHQSTADGLDRVLAYLLEQGYEFVTVSEILAPKI